MSRVKAQLADYSLFAVILNVTANHLQQTTRNKHHKPRKQAYGSKSIYPIYVNNWLQLFNCWQERIVQDVYQLGV